MTFAELQTETFRRIREAVGSGVYFSTEDIKDALNDGYAELSDVTEWFEEYLEIDLLRRRPYYDLFSLIGRSFLSIKPAFDEQVNRWLIPSTVRGLDDHDRRWERVVGRPQRLILRGIRWLGLYPRTEADGTTIKVYYTRLPEPLCADDDEPGFPEGYHQGLVAYALCDLFAQDGESRLSEAAWAEYLGYEHQLQQWVQHRPSRPLMHVMGSATSPR